MKITVIGTGYVGLVSGACFADLGNDVLCLDIDERKVAHLNAGGIPIHEPGLEAIVRRNVEAGRLSFTTDPRQAAAFGRVQFLAVGTPPGEDGAADLQYVIAAARSIGRHLDGYCVIVDKSTVPVGTADLVREAIAEELALRGVSHPFSVVSNPEFLKEGAAVEDFMRPDRVVLGVDDERALRLMRELYAPVQRNHERLIVMDVRSAELTKYAANAMLATRISFMNELANLAERLGADIEMVRKGIGSDSRIGYHFLYPGAGFGGSCFPKDVQALRRTAGQHGMELAILEAVHEVNERQKQVLVDKVVARFGASLAGRRFALWGLAFKPNTDDMREAPSLVVIEALLARGARRPRPPQRRPHPLRPQLPKPPQPPRRPRQLKCLRPPRRPRPPKRPPRSPSPHPRPHRSRHRKRWRRRKGNCFTGSTALAFGTARTRNLSTR
jgi:UDPglucose 6-dehydrogenase